MSSSDDRFYIVNNDTFTPIGKYDLNLCESIAGEKPVLDQVKQVNSHFRLITFNNRIALVSNYGIEFIVIDAEKKQITAERRYSKLPIKPFDGRVPINVLSVFSNKDHIFVIIRDGKVKKVNICVYDWDLNPVKKFILNDYLATFIVSADGKKVYSLVKNGEERDLFEGDLNL